MNKPTGQPQKVITSISEEAISLIMLIQDDPIILEWRPPFNLAYEAKAGYKVARAANQRHRKTPALLLPVSLEEVCLRLLLSGYGVIDTIM